MREFIIWLITACVLILGFRLRYPPLYTLILSGVVQLFLRAGFKSVDAKKDLNQQSTQKSFSHPALRNLYQAGNAVGFGRLQLATRKCVDLMEAALPTLSEPAKQEWLERAEQLSRLIPRAAKLQRDASDEKISKETERVLEKTHRALQTILNQKHQVESSELQVDLRVYEEMLNLESQLENDGLSPDFENPERE